MPSPTPDDALAYCQKPTIHGDRIVFSAEGDLWEVGVEGGHARRLTSSPADHTNARYSPDGRWIAFSSEDEGPLNAWVMPAAGGTARRLTFSGAPTQVVGWSPDGSRVVLRVLGIEGIRAWSLATVPLEGGALSVLPFGRADGIAYHPDGRRVAVHRHAHDPAWWKRYAGGRAGRIWMGDLETGDFTRMPGGPRTDCQPMWIGDKLWFLSDEDGMGDLWCADADGSNRRRVTSHTDFYARYPQAHETRIVYAMGGRLYLLETAGDDPTPREVPVEVLGHSLANRRKFVNPGKSVQSFALSRDGDEAIFTMRGRIVRLPNWHGSARVVAGPPETRFRDAQWLGEEEIVAVAQVDGHDEVFVLPSDGIGEDLGRARRLGGVGRRIRELRPSPDGKRVAVIDQGRGLHVLDAATGESVTVDDSGAGWIRGAAWSPCSTWLAYTRTNTWWHGTLFVWGVADGTSHRVGLPEFSDAAPAWDPAGRFLAFLSSRHLDPHGSAIEHNFDFPAPVRAYVTMLRADECVPFAPEVKAPKEPPKRVTKPIVIDWAEIENRAYPLPFEASRYSQIGCTTKAIAVLEEPLLRMADEWRGENPHDRGTVHSLEIADRKREMAALEHCGGWRASADGERWLYRMGESFRVLEGAIKPKPPENGDDDRVAPSTGWIDLERIALPVVPRAEYRQMFLEAWAMQRDHYYDPGLAGVDWDACRDRYLPLVNRIRTRAELTDLLWEVQGELGTSHAYAFGGDVSVARKYAVGHLGCDLEQDAAGRYRIGRIYPGDVWAEKRHSPLAEPGKGLTEGTYVLAVNGNDVGADRHPGEWMLQTAGKQVVLTVADDADGANRRSVIVTPVADEYYLRYRAWVDGNQGRVRQATDGRVGYIHIPNMGPEGAMEFHRGFLWQMETTQALIVDNRYNGGGNISGILLSKLLKRPIGWDVSRYGQSGTYPSHSPRGPVVVLTNENAGSDGDMFSQATKASGLGPLIGMRTWGGVVGIDMAKDLVDGGLTTQPEYATWFPDARWGVENHGVDPDIEVDRTPADAMRGEDPQLARGIEEALRLLDTNPGTPPDFGPYPNLRWPPQ